MKKIVIIVGLVILMSCETVLEDIPVPTVQVKPVVFANISQLNVRPTIELTKSKPILNETSSNEYEEVLGANTVVTVDGKEYTFQYVNGDGYRHAGAIDMVGGETVMLRVETPEFGEVSAEAIVPDKIPSYQITVDSIRRQFDTEYTVLIDIPQMGEKEQFYRIEAYSDNGFDTSEVFTDGAYFTNERRVAGSARLAARLFTWETGSGSVPKLFIILSSITQDHYEYGTALENYQPDNPFAEPTPLPNNVKGGLGVFTISMSEVIQLN